MNRLSEDPKYPLYDWRLEAGAQNTILGYYEWLEHRWEEELHDIPPNLIPEMIDLQASGEEGWHMTYCEEGDFLAIQPVFGSGLLGWDQVMPHLFCRAEEGRVLHRKALWLLDRYNTRKERETAARLKLFKPGVRVRWNDPDGGVYSTEGELAFLGSVGPSSQNEDDMLTLVMRREGGEEWMAEVLPEELEILSDN